MNRHYTFIIFSIFCNQQVKHVQYTPRHIKTRNFAESIINRQYVDPSINIRRISPAIDGLPISTGAGATGGLSSGLDHIPAIDGPSISTADGATGVIKNPADYYYYSVENTEAPSPSLITETTIDSNLSQSINNTQQNQKSPNTEVKSETALKKLYIKGTTLLGNLKKGIKNLYKSKPFQRARVFAVDKLQKGAKSFLGSETVDTLKKQVIEKGNNITKTVGTALINRGAAILVGSAAAAAVGK